MFNFHIPTRCIPTMPPRKKTVKTPRKRASTNELASAPEPIRQKLTVQQWKGIENEHRWEKLDIPPGIGIRMVCDVRRFAREPEQARSSGKKNPPSLFESQPQNTVKMHSPPFASQFANKSKQQSFQTQPHSFYFAQTSPHQTRSHHQTYRKITLGGGHHY